MKVLRQKEYPEGMFTYTFVGRGAGETDAVIELTCSRERQEARGTREARYAIDPLCRGPGRLQDKAAGTAGVARLS